MSTIDWIILLLVVCFELQIVSFSVVLDYGRLKYKHKKEFVAFWDSFDPDETPVVSGSPFGYNQWREHEVDPVLAYYLDMAAPSYEENGNE